MHTCILICARFKFMYYHSWLLRRVSEYIVNIWANGAYSNTFNNLNLVRPKVGDLRWEGKWVFHTFYRSFDLLLLLTNISCYWSLCLFDIFTDQGFFYFPLYRDIAMSVLWYTKRKVLHSHCLVYKFDLNQQPLHLHPNTLTTTPWDPFRLKRHLPSSIMHRQITSNSLTIAYIWILPLNSNQHFDMRYNVHSWRAARGLALTLIKGKSNGGLPNGAILLYPLSAPHKYARPSRTWKAGIGSSLDI